MNTMPLPADAVVILCSDGLTDALPDENILKQVTGIADLQITVDNLGKRAFHQGSADNITILAVELGNMKRNGSPVTIEKAMPESHRGLQQKRKSHYRVVLAATTAALILTASAAGYLYYLAWIKNPAGYTKIIEAPKVRPEINTESAAQMQAATQPDAPPNLSVQEILSKPTMVKIDKTPKKENIPKTGGESGKKAANIVPPIPPTPPKGQDPIAPSSRPVVPQLKSPQPTAVTDEQEKPLTTQSLQSGGKEITAPSFPQATPGQTTLPHAPGTNQQAPPQPRPADSQKDGRTLPMAGDTPKTAGAPAADDKQNQVKKPDDPKPNPPEEGKKPAASGGAVPSKPTSPAVQAPAQAPHPAALDQAATLPGP